MKKFESSLNFSKEKVKNILFDKINEEKTNIEKKKTKENIEKDEELISKANKLYDPHKINIVSLFAIPVSTTLLIICWYFCWQECR